ncbi:alpha-amylase family glycosyl hydrolase [Roseibacillus ishigakijimensis]|uniref:1,4-alpha-glucan branching enzyme n=1 Tax=Roseibacillus ishigakijimensis TaxID=454146 RepID=A0A934VM15_9BACT|nr:alpha-amylase family glycosyl hydrolase [Roseibacillus ishigakijimensis]MBK1833792.1 alpha amylase C-terminal domain-containing protein [Roseibacillus ishigakijimensis]
MDKELALIADDPWLEPYAHAITGRRDRFRESLAHNDWRARAQLHRKHGLQFDAEAQLWCYRDYAPNAYQLSLVGDFNNWDKNAHPATRQENGIWELTLPATALSHLSNYKVCVSGDNGTHHRLSPFTYYATQNPENHEFTGTIWQPANPYQWQNEAPPKPTAPRIYEAHIGLATEREGVGTYEEFRTFVLPRIAKLGYDTVQLMAIAEHPYYGSFGYHVANFFAPASRFGTPDELRALVDEAHGLGISVVLDLVHSHTVKNFAEGLREFDGREGYLLHAGPAGEHEQWDSLLFDYGHPATLDFLLSNLAYWLEEFRFDGFRFDGVTSILYHHHGDTTFDHYDKYFYDGVEWNAVTYLQLANHLIREINPAALTIAEDFSGLPGCCRPPEDGGLGFDYRLGMGIPDHWIKLLKHTPDEQWNLQEIWHQLSNRRSGEKTVAYAESHDQALVGDKTLAFWLMDKEMYWHMSKGDENPIIDRGIALHKMIRLLTMIAGGEAWLSFIGNEFGHPEWLDFPREGNNWSYKYARRQWSLADNPELKYGGLQNFEAALLKLVRDHRVLEAAPAQLLNIDQDNLSIQFERANLLFALNFHPHHSIEGYQFPTHLPGSYRHLLDTDQAEFEGHQRLAAGTTHEAPEGTISIYLPARCGVILEKC